MPCAEAPRASIMWHGCRDLRDHWRQRFDRSAVDRHPHAPQARTADLICVSLQVSCSFGMELSHRERAAWELEETANGKWRTAVGAGSIRWVAISEIGRETKTGPA